MQPHQASGMLIGGQLVQASDGARLDAICPSNEEVFSSIPAGTAKDAKAAVSAAVAAFPKWKLTTGAERAGFMRAIAEKLKAEKTALARLETTDQGKSVDEAEWDLDDVIACFEYYADLAAAMDTDEPEAVALPMEQFRGSIVREPLGPVALITPWNYPLLMAAWKVAPALAAGCTMVLKPSEHASLTCLEMGRIAREVGLPPGVLNVITGLGSTCGAALSGDARLAKVAFTGSVVSGRAIALACAQNLTPTTMELGGKSSLIVFDDVDVPKAVEWAMFGVFWGNGQICSSTSRLIVHEKIAPAFYKQLKERAEGIKAGNALEPGNRLGPVANKMQFDKVMAYIEAAKADGDTLLTGGGRPPAVPGTRGYWIAPTVFTGVSPASRIWREEIFGPVLASATFRTEEEAVAMANATEFGLAGAVISGDAARCQRVSAALEVGITWINCSQPCFVEMPWGGKKLSGYGRELSRVGLENYRSIKSVIKNVGAEAWEWFPPCPSKL